MQNYGLMKKIFSNRLYPLPPEKSLDLLIYSQLPDKRWDSSDIKCVYYQKKRYTYNQSLLANDDQVG